MLGVLVNVGAVLLGGGFGLLLKRGISQTVSRNVMIALGLCTIYLGIDGVLEGENTVVLILSIALGTALGTLIDLDGRLERMGARLEQKWSGGQKGTFAQGFVTSSLLFCVGAMAIVGSLQSGLAGNHQILFTKSILDGIAACMLASTMGVGVLFSALCVLLYQGALALGAGLFTGLLAEGNLVAEITCAGSLMILALGLNMVGATKIKVANLLPGLVFVPLFQWISQWLPL